jgi:hypothetical protein
MMPMVKKSIMRIQMDIGGNKNIIPIITVSILRIQMDIGINKNMMSMVTKSILRIHMVKSVITGQRLHVMERL